MSWFANFFGKKTEKPDEKPKHVEQQEPAIAVKAFYRPKKDKVTEKKGFSEARAAKPSLGITGWVGWNFCAQMDVQGVQHHRAAATSAFHNLKQGDVVELIRTSSNPHDKNAIEIRWKGSLIGYIEKSVAALAAERISPDTPIQAEYSSGHLSKSGFLRITIQPLVPDVASRKRNGWHMASR